MSAKDEISLFFLFIFFYQADSLDYFHCHVNVSVKPECAGLCDNALG